MMTSIKMFLSYNNNEKVVQLPVVPNELPELVQAMANEEMTTNVNTLTLLGNKKPRTFTLELFLPTQEYDFCAGNGEDVIDLLDYVCNNKIPARLVITDNLKELLNIAIAINSYSYHYDTVKNIKASISISEYMFMTTSTDTESDDEDNFITTSVTYNGKTIQVKSQNKDGSILVYARDVLNLLGKTVGWNAEKKRVTADDTLLDIETIIYDGNAYCYIRKLAEFLGYSIEYNANDKSVTLKDGES